MKNHRLSLVLALCLTLQANAGIPVIDITSIAQSILIVQGQAKQLTQLIDQVVTAKNQLTAAKSTLTSMTGSRGMSTLANMSGLRQIVPPEFLNAASSIQKLGAAGASPAAKAIYASIKQYGCEERFKIDPIMRKLCEADAYAAPTTLNLVQDSVKRSQDRAAKLQQMLGSIDTADVKAAADLQNRVQLESAMLQNENMMMTMALQSQELQQRLVAQQLKERSLKQLTAGDSPTWSFK